MGNPETGNGNEKSSGNDARDKLRGIASEVTDEQIFDSLDKLLKKMPTKGANEGDEPEKIYTNEEEDKTTIQIIQYISRIRDDTQRRNYWNEIKHNTYSLSPVVLRNVGPQILQLSQQFETMDIFASPYVSRNILRSFSSDFVKKNWETLMKIPEFLSKLRNDIAFILDYPGSYQGLSSNEKATIDILIWKYLKNMIQKDGYLGIEGVNLTKIKGQAGKFGKELELRQMKLGIEEIEKQLRIANKTQTESLDEEHIRGKYSERTGQISETIGQKLKLQQDALYEIVLTEWVKAGKFDNSSK